MTTRHRFHRLAAATLAVVTLFAVGAGATAPGAIAADTRCAIPPVELLAGALPKPPPTKRWRVKAVWKTWGVWNLQVFLETVGQDNGSDDLGRGTLRWDCAYSVDLDLKREPILGVPVTLSGNLSGADITAPDNTAITVPFGGLSGAGMLGMVDGTTTWDADGISIGSTLLIPCPVSGALKAPVSIAYTSFTDWKLTLNDTNTGECFGENGLGITDIPLTGSITSIDNVLDGEITGTTNDGTVITIRIGGTPLAPAFSFAVVPSTGSTENPSDPGSDGFQPAFDSTGFEQYPDASTAGIGTLPACVVPRVRKGMTLSTVRRRVRQGGCSLKIKRQHSSVRRGRVIKVTPRSGKRIAVGRVVTVYVSTGPKKR